MQEKETIFAAQIQPLLEQMFNLCVQNRIPMIAAFCLEHQQRDDGKSEMAIAGCVNLKREIEPPPAMVLAAAILRVPGFEPEYETE